MASAATRTFWEKAGDVGLSIANGLWNEGAKAVVQAREEIHRGWFGQYPQQDQKEVQTGNIHGSADDLGKGDPMGRTGRDDQWSEDNFHAFKGAHDHYVASGIDTQELESEWNWAEQDGQIPAAFIETLERETSQNDMER